MSEDRSSRPDDPPQDAGPRATAGGLPRVELLGDATGPTWWEGRPAAPSRGGRRFLVGFAVLVLVGGGLLFGRSWSAEREARQAVELTATFGVWSSSTTRPGGEVGFFVLVRNDGALPVSVTSVAAAEPGLRLRMRDDGVRPIVPGREIEIPLSVRLTCVVGAGAARPSLDADIGVQREDGEATSRRAVLRPAALVRDVAATLCAVRPGLRDHELSGAVLRAPTGG